MKDFFSNCQLPHDCRKEEKKNPKFLSLMADALCSSTIFSSFQRTSLPRQQQPFNRNNNFCKFPSIRCGAKDSNGDGFYPWDPSFLHGDSAIEWVSEDRVTLFTTDGLVQIGGSVAPRRISSSDKLAKLKASQRFQRQESDYMDPKHGLCLGALFDIAATNGLDTGRRLCIFGFCRSIEMLSDVVEDTVLGHGGEIVNAEKASKGLQEKLTMTVAVPLLWGVPPVSETLHLAVRTGGGIVEKVYWQWDFL